MDNKADLTTGGILRKLFIVSLPVMGTQIMQMLYNTIDMFWLGRLSSDSVAASGAAGMFLWLSMMFMLFVRMGAEIGVSQNKGAGDMQAGKAYAQNALLLALLFGVGYCLLMTTFTEELLSFFDIREPNVAESAREYLQVAALGIPASFMTGAITGAYNGAGITRIPFYVSAAGLLMSIVLDPILIFTFAFGIRGAAIAMASSQWFTFVTLMMCIMKHKERPFDEFTLQWRLDRSKLRQITYWSLPISLETGLFASLSMLVTRLVSSFGADMLAIQRVGGNIESLSWLIAGGFGSALTTFMGQNYGAGKWDRIRSGFRISSIAMLIWGTVTTLILVIFGYQLVGLFLEEDSLRLLGASYLRHLAVCQITICLASCGAGFFRGTGRTLPPSAVAIACNVSRVPLCYLLVLPFSIYGVWYGIVATSFVRDALIFVWAFAALTRGRYRMTQPRLS